MYLFDWEIWKMHIESSIVFTIGNTVVCSYFRCLNLGQTHIKVARTKLFNVIPDHSDTDEDEGKRDDSLEMNHIFSLTHFF